MVLSPVIPRNGTPGLFRLATTSQDFPRLKASGGTETYPPVGEVLLPSSPRGDKGLSPPPEASELGSDATWGAAPLCSCPNSMRRTILILIDFAMLVISHGYSFRDTVQAVGYARSRVVVINVVLGLVVWDSGSQCLISSLVETQVHHSNPLRPGFCVLETPAMSLRTLRTSSSP